MDDGGGYPAEVYLRDVRLAVDEALTVEAHLLHAEERDALLRYKRLSDDAKVLGIRLYNRRRGWVKLATCKNYPVGDLVAAGRELAGAGLADIVVVDGILTAAAGAGGGEEREPSCSDVAAAATSVLQMVPVADMRWILKAAQLPFEGERQVLQRRLARVVSGQSVDGQARLSFVRGLSGAAQRAARAVVVAAGDCIRLCPAFTGPFGLAMRLFVLQTPKDYLQFLLDPGGKGVQAAGSAAHRGGKGHGGKGKGHHHRPPPWLAHDRSAAAAAQPSGGGASPARGRPGVSDGGTDTGGVAGGHRGGGGIGSDGLAWPPHRPILPHLEPLTHVPTVLFTGLRKWPSPALARAKPQSVFTTRAAFDDYETALNALGHVARAIDAGLRHKDRALILEEVRPFVEYAAARLAGDGGRSPSAGTSATGATTAATDTTSAGTDAVSGGTSADAIHPQHPSEAGSCAMSLIPPTPPPAAPAVHDTAAGAGEGVRVPGRRSRGSAGRAADVDVVDLVSSDGEPDAAGGQTMGALAREATPHIAAPPAQPPSSIEVVDLLESSDGEDSVVDLISSSSCCSDGDRGGDGAPGRCNDIDLDDDDGDTRAPAAQGVAGEPRKQDVAEAAVVVMTKTATAAGHASPAGALDGDGGGGGRISDAGHRIGDNGDGDASSSEFDSVFGSYRGSQEGVGGNVTAAGGGCHVHPSIIAPAVGHVDAAAAAAAATDDAAHDNQLLLEGCGGDGSESLDDNAGTAGVTAGGAMGSGVSGGTVDAAPRPPVPPGAAGGASDPGERVTTTEDGDTTATAAGEPVTCRGCGKIHEDGSLVEHTFSADHVWRLLLVEAIAAYEGCRRYREAVALGHIALRCTRFHMRRRGKVWQRLVINAGHLKDAEHVLAVCRYALGSSDNAYMAGADRLWLERRFAKLQPEAVVPAPEDQVFPTTLSEPVVRMVVGYRWEGSRWPVWMLDTCEDRTCEYHVHKAKHAAAGDAKERGGEAADNAVRNTDGKADEDRGIGNGSNSNDGGGGAPRDAHATDEGNNQAGGDGAAATDQLAKGSTTSHVRNTVAHDWDQGQGESRVVVPDAGGSVEYADPGAAGVVGTTLAPTASPQPPPAPDVDAGDAAAANAVCESEASVSPTSSSLPSASMFLGNLQPPVPEWKKAPAAAAAGDDSEGAAATRPAKPPSLGRVENAALAAICKAEGEGWTGTHCEGGTLQFLFALLFWEVLFDPDVDGALPLRFMSCPLDWGKPEFARMRGGAIRARVDQLAETSRDELCASVAERYARYHGTLAIACNWETPCDRLVEVAACLGPERAGLLCKEFATYFQMSGMPDLLLWNPVTLDVIASEVKGPGDTLSTKQEIWLTRLAAIGIRCEVCKVMDEGMWRKLIEPPRPAAAAAGVKGRKRKRGKGEGGADTNNTDSNNAAAEGVDGVQAAKRRRGGAPRRSTKKKAEEDAAGGDVASAPGEVGASGPPTDDPPHSTPRRRARNGSGGGGARKRPAGASPSSTASKRQKTAAAGIPQASDAMDLTADE